ncbi:type VII secretion protein EccB [Micromonospora sp. NBC_01813]|uniref:type VII secretion protein EccB n=1 Tax=Micromonospora sp. NBC_01813 TaxID=2975988 RepID=UPI002DD86F5D|nr:type VII secretion protein EccB [Micromonospora sp. NBC_01813]WSA06278.1 type VII secretion protein EccB [Micromonospora sp. NBC_01813]
MASRRDQLQAHQFLGQRVVSALVVRETDPEQPPFRRPTVAAIGSFAVAVIALAVVGIYGMIVPGGNRSWQAGDAVVIEKETGTRYVYLDGRLHPAANYASALLALGRHAPSRRVSRASLVGVPRGPRIGIPDAPDALPGPDRVLDGSWTFCSQPGVDRTGAAVPESVLMVGRRPAAGQSMDGRALLVEAAETGRRHLLAGGYRHEIDERDAEAVRVALGAGSAIRVSPAVVEVLPAGHPLGPIAVPDAGQPSRAVPGRTDIRAGQVLVAATSEGVRHYLAEVERLRPISPLQTDIQLASASSATAYGTGHPAAVPLSLLEAASAVQAPDVPAAAGDPPRVPPRFAAGDAGTTICLVFDPGAAVPHLILNPPMPAADPMAATPGRTADGARMADRMVVPPGWVAVVESMPAPAAPAGTVLVVTDLGVAHPLADVALLEVLGYPAARPTRMPASLVARIPLGSGLSHSAALRRA